MPFSRLFRASVLVALAVVLSADSQAQTDRFPDLWVTDLRVEGMAILGDTVFVAGRFRRVGPPTGQLVVLDKATGEADTDYPRVNAYALTSFSSGPSVVVSDEQGGYFVGGQFAVLDGSTPHLNLVHVRADGTVDPAFRLDPTLRSEAVSATVRAILLDRSAASPSGAGVLYVGGQFDAIGGQPRAAFAVLDAGTGAVLPFDAALSLELAPQDNPRDVEVSTIATRAGVVYIGGDFSHVAGQPKRALAALDASTGAVLPWRADLSSEIPGFTPFPFALALGNSTLYLSGLFIDFVNGQRRFGTAEVTLADPATGEGGTPTPWAPDPPGPDNLIASDLVVVGGSVYAAANTFGGFPLARIDRTTGAVTSLLAGYRSAEALAYDPEGGPSGTGTLHVGVGRSTASNNSVTFPVVVGVDPATGQPTGFEVRGAGGSVGALAVEPGPEGRLFVGGTFVTFGAGVTPRQGLAAFDLTTGLPTPFAADVTGPGEGLFEDVALSPDGRFLYGYSNVVGGAALRLTEFEIATGARREFVPQSLTAATYGAHAPAAQTDASARTAERTAGAQASNPRVENATSALVVTDTRVCLSVNGVACYDRATAAQLFYTPMVYVGSISENNGDLVYLPPGGPVVGPGGANGTLYLSALVSEAPPGTSRPALVAVDFETGAILTEWTPGFDFVGAEGYSLSLFDRDGLGPAQAVLYAGGGREWTVRGTSREALAMFDPLTAALGSWAPRVSGGTAPALTMATHRTPDGDGAVYVGGTLFFANGVRSRSAVAFDARVGVRRAWGEGVTGTPRVLMVSERHGAVFVGGSVGLVGTGHSNLVALAPAAPILPTVGESGGPDAPSAASLALAGPNPFRSQTVLALTLVEASPVEASLFDVLGRRVDVLHDGTLAAGTHTLTVNASALPVGVYVARVVGDAFAASRTLTVVR